MKSKSLTTTERRLRNAHPGEILLKEFLEPMNLSAYKLLKETGIPQTRLSEIIRSRRRISADTALRLSRYFGNSAQFWLGLQDDFDLEKEKGKLEDILSAIRPFQYQAESAI